MWLHVVALVARIHCSTLCAGAHSMSLLDVDQHLKVSVVDREVAVRPYAAGAESRVREVRASHAVRAHQLSTPGNARRSHADEPLGDTHNSI